MAENEQMTLNGKTDRSLQGTADRGGTFTLRLDAGLTLLYGNGFFASLRGCEPEELTGKSLVDLIHPDDRDYVLALTERARREDRRFAGWEMRILTPNGGQRTVLAGGTLRECGGETLLDGYFADITRQREIEEELRQSEEKFRIATQNTDINFWTYVFATKTIINTPASKRQHRSEDTVSDVPDSLIADGFVRPDCAEAFVKMYRDLEGGAKTAVGDFWFRRPEGGGWWCEHISYTNVFGEDGKPLRAYAVGKDVTAAKNAEAKYRGEIEYESAAQSSSLLAKGRADVTKDIVESFSAVRFTDIAHAGMAYSTSVENLSGGCFTAMDRQTLLRTMGRENILRDFASGDTNFEVEYRRRMSDGSAVWVRTTVRIYRNPENDDVMVFVYTYDINDQKIKDGIIDAVTSLEYDYISFIDLKNERYQIYLGGEDIRKLMPVVEENYSQSIRDVNAIIVVPEDRERMINDMVSDGIRRNLENQSMFSEVGSVYEKDGSVRQKRIQYAYLDRLSEQVVMTRTDVTEMLKQQKQQQAELRAALQTAEDASSAKSVFLSRMSHEIRTPMNAIMGMTAIAREPGASREKIEDCLEKIDSSSHYLLTLINDILDMSRIESGRIELVRDEFGLGEMIEAIRTVAEPVARSNAIRCEFEDRTDGRARYLGDKTRITQILVNLMGNAVKFTKPGGRVRFTAEETEASPTAARVKFTVADNGIGITEEFMKNGMFRPFSQEDGTTTSKYAGSGLGLAISKNLVDLMGGTINAESKVGVGTTFTVALPLTRAAAAEKPAAEPKTELTIPAGCRILVAEDNPLNIMIAKNLLEKKGAQVEVANNGRLALELFENSAPGFYQAILMDIRMPVMDGLTAARRIRGLNRPDAAAVPIIAMTANALDEDRRDSAEAGMDAHLAKPFDPTQFYAVLAESLSKPRKIN